ncbi:hypothetical protein K435DRAFT_846268 [Dendrothele bispora CBS 962.96]|uniref:DUF6533 domain-containing protein n=1 Tax=Dendrothele bispora (strain CBS 962.96) TaxID=1314807 RepID=A0A4S8KNP7_DENBC|nr:hypothetical protein K435DRAFT_846268 [Dendrothele bispora CBS 962.96]
MTVFLSGLTPFLSNLAVVNYIKVACLALLTYDTVTTLNLEFEYIWKRRWTVVKALYLYSRYSTFIDTFIAVYERLGPNITDCNRTMTFTTIYAGWGISLSEVLLMIRTYAIYSRSRTIVIFFIFLWVPLASISIWAAIKWTGAISNDDTLSQLMHEASLPGNIECLLTRQSKISIVCYGAFLAGETVIVLMTAYKAFSTWRCARRAGTTNSYLITSFYRDGILLYFAILPFTIVGALGPLYLPPGLSDVGETPLRVMHTILTCHLILRVRHIAQEEETSTHKISVLRFATNSNLYGSETEVV